MSPISWTGEERQPSWLPTHSSIQWFLNLLCKKQTSNYQEKKQSGFFSCLLLLHPWEEWLKDFYLAFKITKFGTEEKSTALLFPALRIFLGWFNEWVAGSLGKLQREPLAWVGKGQSLGKMGVSDSKTGITLLLILLTLAFQTHLCPHPLDFRLLGTGGQWLLTPTTQS